MEACTCSVPDLRAYDDLWTCLGCGAAIRLQNTEIDAPINIQASAVNLRIPSRHHTVPQHFEHPQEIALGASNEYATREYVHTPIDLTRAGGIRLMQLFPGKHDDELVCQIYQANLDDYPMYEAISYTWADESGCRKLSGKLYCPDRYLPITVNCDRALRRVRHPGFRRHVWIDSVCIQQSNDQERSHQVSSMNNIYARASQVLIYAGESLPSSDRILDRLGNTRRSCVEDDSSLYQQDLQRLVERPWFHRVWIIQEVVLAKRAVFIVGGKSLDWSSLSLQRLNNLGLQPMTSSGRIPGVFQWMKRQNSCIELLPALQMSRSCQASDPRDKVFALLGLPFGNATEVIKPDYGSDTNQIFTRLAVFSVLRQQSLAILSYLSPLRRYGRTLASWVPDWSELYSRIPAKPCFHQQASSNHQEQRRWCSNGSELGFFVDTMVQDVGTAMSLSHPVQVLAVPAIRLDIITRPHMKIPFEARQGRRLSQETHKLYVQYPPNSYTTNLHSRFWSRFEHHLVPIKHTCETVDSCDVEPYDSMSHPPMFLTDSPPLHDAVQVQRAKEAPVQVPCITAASTLSNLGKETQITMNLVDDSDIPIDLTVRLDVPPIAPVLDVDETCVYPKYVYDSEELEAFEKEKVGLFEKEIEPFMIKFLLRRRRDNRFETTQSLGFSSYVVEEGDSIWYLEGASVPFVLRQRADHYLVVGECYLHGADRLRGCHLAEPNSRCHWHGKERVEGCGVPEVIKLH